MTGPKTQIDKNRVYSTSLYYRGRGGPSQFPSNFPQPIFKDGAHSGAFLKFITIQLAISDVTFDFLYLLKILSNYIYVRCCQLLSFHLIVS